MAPCMYTCAGTAILIVLILVFVQTRRRLFFPEILFVRFYLLYMRKRAKSLVSG